MRNSLRVRILKSPYPEYVGREGVILEPHQGGNMYGSAGVGMDGVIRIAFDNFWTRPDGMSAEEADDSTWAFEGEWEYI